VKKKRGKINVWYLDAAHASLNGRGAGGSGFERGRSLESLTRVYVCSLTVGLIQCRFFVFDGKVFCPKKMRGPGQSDAGTERRPPRAGSCVLVRWELGLEYFCIFFIIHFN